VPRRGIAASMAAWGKKMPDRPPLVQEEEFTESFLKGSGPGGQKIVCSDQFDLTADDKSEIEASANQRVAEQNVFRRAVEAHSHWPGIESAGHTLSITEPEDCQGDACGES